MFSIDPNFSSVVQEKMCEESTSFDLTPYDLTSAIDAVDKLLREQASDIGKGESSEEFSGESLSSGSAHDGLSHISKSAPCRC